MLDSYKIGGASILGIVASCNLKIKLNVIEGRTFSEVSRKFENNNLLFLTLLLASVKILYIVSKFTDGI